MRVLLKRLASGKYHNLISRFAIVRRTYSALAAIYQLYFEKSSNNNIDGPSVIFHNQNLQHCVSKIKSDGLVQGLVLSPELVGKIFQYAVVAPCNCAKLDRSIFKHEVSDGKLQTGELVLTASVEELNQCEAVSVVEREPFLLRIVTHYLGYEPSKIKSELRWSFCSKIPAHTQWERAHRLQRGTENCRTLSARWERLTERLKYHLTADPAYSTVYYHFDTFGYNSVCAYFYITDVDRYSGAHVVVRGSHSRKTFRMLMSSGVYPESRLLSYYGPKNEIVIEGPAGFGFIEDAACYHKLLPPNKADRLVLMLTYS